MTTSFTQITAQQFFVVDHQAGNHPSEGGRPSGNSIRFPDYLRISLSKVVQSIRETGRGGMTSCSCIHLKPLPNSLPPDQVDIERNPSLSRR